MDKLPNQEILPVDLLNRLSNINPDYLLDTANYLLNLDIRELNRCSWSSHPQYEDILFSSQIIWWQLVGAALARQNAMRSPSMMTAWTWDLYKTRNIPDFLRSMIQNQIDRDLSPDDAIENVLTFLRGWAASNYPKYLTALGEIANYVLIKRGLKGCDYAPFLTSIANLFQSYSFSSLEEHSTLTDITETFFANKLFGGGNDLEIVVSSLHHHESADGFHEFESKKSDPFHGEFPVPISPDLSASAED